MARDEIVEKAERGSPPCGPCIRSKKAPADQHQESEIRVPAARRDDWQCREQAGDQHGECGHEACSGDWPLADVAFLGEGGANHYCVSAALPASSVIAAGS